MRKYEINMDRNRLKYFRAAVLKRDSYKCRKCKKKGRGVLQVHHIKKFSQFKSISDDVNNGITLCKRCHALFKGNEELFERECHMMLADPKILGKISQMLYK